MHERQAQREQTPRGQRKAGRPPVAKPSGQQQLLARKYNLTDPDSGIVRHRGMLMQGYNVQTAVADGQVIVAVRATSTSPDGGQLTPTVHAAEGNLARAGITDPVSEVLADSGYWNHRQVTELRDHGVRVLVPPRVGHARTPDRLHPVGVDMLHQLSTHEGKAAYQRRQQIIEPVFAHWKHIRQITRVWRRGRQAVQAEIDLIATTHNLLKLYRAAPTAA